MLKNCMIPMHFRVSFLKKIKLSAENGVVMTWGWGEHGQLGLGDTSDQTSPQLVSMSQNVAHKHIISKVYCGSGFTFSVRTWRANQP